MSPQTSNFTGWASVKTKSADYTLAGGDEGHLIYLDTNTTTITVPADAFYPRADDPTKDTLIEQIPVGTVIGVVAADGVTGCTVEVGTGVTVNGGAAGTSTAVTAHETISLVKVAANTWSATDGVANAFA